MKTATRTCPFLSLSLLAAIGCDPVPAPTPDLGGQDLATAAELGAPSDQAAPQVTLTVAVTGQGIVSAEAIGLRCAAATCQVTVPAATPLTLAVTPDLKNQFSGWGGSCAGTAGGCTLTLLADGAVTATFAPKTCVASDWCKETTNETASLFGVYAQGPRNVLAVGEKGTVLHFDGGSWRKVPSGSTATLRGVFFASAQQAWIVGTAGTVLRYDAGAISQVASPVTSQLNGVTGASPNEIYMVGSGGVILSYDGAAVTRMVSGVSVDLLGAWAAGSKDVFVSTSDSSQSVGMRVGYSVLRYDGSTWKRSLTIPATTSITMAGIHGTDPTNVWMAGDGSSSGAIPTGCMWYRAGKLGYGIIGCSTLNAVWTSSPTDAWMAGAGGVLKHWSGAAFEGQHPSYNIPSGTGVALQGLHGLSATSIWAVGQAGTILHLER